MRVEMLNQYRMIVDVDGDKHETVYRTNKTLGALKESDLFAGFEGIQDRSEWVVDEPRMFIFARVIKNAQGDINQVQEFNKGKIGKEGFYAFKELKEADLVDVQGYGIVDDFDQFEKAYKEAATKK